MIKTTLAVYVSFQASADFLELAIALQTPLL